MTTEVARGKRQRRLAEQSGDATDQPERRTTDD
jgi:hypothetical protein